MATGRTMLMITMVTLVGLAESQGPMELRLSENVIFEPITEVATTRSRWTLTFVTDLAPYKNFVREAERQVEQVGVVIDQWAQTWVKGWLMGGYRREYRSLQSVLKDLQSDWGEIVALQNPDKRVKRSVLPFIGQGLSWLFGVATEDDLEAIRNNIRVLADNQEQVNHVIEESLSAINITRVELKENRQAINNMASIIRSMGGSIIDLSADLRELSNAFQMHVRLSLMILEVQDTLERGLHYLERLKLKMNHMALGHLAPSVVSPEMLRSVLRKVEREIPETLSLPHDPNNIWNYYQTTVGVTVIHESTLITISTIPLVSQDDKYTLYRVHNVPMPKGGLVASYVLEGVGLAVNLKGTQYMLLSAEELIRCNAQSCALRAPRCSMARSKLCLVALFRNEQPKIRNNCKSIVGGGQLPFARNIRNGLWIVVTPDRITFSVICSQSRTTIAVDPPVGYVNLNMTCYAVADDITLPAYFRGESRHELRNVNMSLLPLRDMSKFQVWGSLGNVTFSVKDLEGLPELKETTSIPLGHLTRELKRMGRITLPDPKDHWVTTWVICGILLVVVILGLVGLVLYKKGLIKGPLVRSMVGQSSTEKEPTGFVEAIEMREVTSRVEALPGTSQEPTVVAPWTGVLE
jgi:hypothetical protein